MPLWPIATEWHPQPHLHIPAKALQLAPAGDHKTQGSATAYEFDEHTLYRPPGGRSLTGPLEAIAQSATHRPASALLSASWSLYLGARLPTDLHWLDRLVWMMRAREALCHPPAGSGERALARWRRLFAKLGLSGRLQQRNFTTQDIDSITTRAWNLRTLGSHSAELALLALGYPTERVVRFRDGQSIAGAELAPLYISEGTQPFFAAVQIATSELWQRMLEHNFAEAEWEALFA
jgi:hypothetical protein